MGKNYCPAGPLTGMRLILAFPAGTTFVPVMQMRHPECIIGKILHCVQNDRNSISTNLVVYYRRKIIL